MNSRRRFLKTASAAGLLGASGLMPALSAFPAHAADTTGYKALVCVFLLGGMDCHDTLLPYDQASYDRYAEIRAPLMQLYAGQPSGSSRDRSRLLELIPDNDADFGGRRFALPEHMSGIKGLFDSGSAAIVSNVGPLSEPLTKTEWDNQSANTPKRLFSHNDQQSTWMSSQPEGAQFGWGGRFADAVYNSGGVTDSTFLTITSLGNELFLTGDVTQAFQVGTGGPSELEILKFYEGFRGTPDGEEMYQRMRDHFEAMDFNRSNLIERDIAAAMNGAIQTNELFKEAIDQKTDFSALFPPNFLGQQLRSVAETISVRGLLGKPRQIFFVAIGGFDTHSNQATDLPGLHTEIDTGVTAFYESLVQMGLTSDVTLFTASDFGRTLAVNGDGTDHGWGSHHFVVGDAVAGRNIFGDVPPYDFGHDYDAGSGRLIPSTSVEQFAEPMGRWFGLNDTELLAALPNLGSFSAPSLTFV
ncbi:MAG: DUF1501 domain-containing protein [Hellea sp.]|nr:DUF1501 domain-containing protein [Hellea sp.]